MAALSAPYAREASSWQAPPPRLRARGVTSTSPPVTVPHAGALAAAAGARPGRPAARAPVRGGPRARPARRLGADPAEPGFPPQPPFPLRALHRVVQRRLVKDQGGAMTSCDTEL